MIKKNKNIAAAARELGAPVAESLGLALWDVEYVREGADFILRYTIDSEKGVGIEDCEAFARAVNPILDEADPIEGFYHLEVSSPGIERELKYPEHFLICTEEKVEIRLYAPRDGQKIFTGILGGLDTETDEIVIADDKEQELRFKRSDVALIHTVYDFTAADYEDEEIEEAEESTDEIGE